ncbi:uncharacterized protein [Brachionichthys hirsutus]|uniref:uncharacterized protein n=1 Tax=Brachionichthys hirsutus TaxID=412623 RepID=UPI00360535EE
MRLFSFLLGVSLGAVCAAENQWCYTGCSNTPGNWKDLPGSSCGDNKQSPINIITGKVKIDPNLHNFSFLNFSSQHVIKSFVNNGHTAKFKLKENEVEVSGGGLNGTYSTIQFHFHWGETVLHPGSEHKMDGKQFPMEMHIVSLKKGLTTQEALDDPEGVAALGFFINGLEEGDASGPWSDLTSYLTDTEDVEVTINHNISIDELIGDVDRTEFYRYTGSLTTPNCSEAVVWTVFREPISIHNSLIKLFPNKTGLTNIFRPVQDLNERKVFASPGTVPSHEWCYDDSCEFGPSNWHLLPHSFCNKERQSPINIKQENVSVDKSLKDFTFKNYDDKHAFGNVINTGHTVKCNVKEGAEISGGGLGHGYATLQLHFHWGSASQDSEGSEHLVDSRRYPMEMHIVHKRKDFELEDALKKGNGLAVLAFFIEAKNEAKSSDGSEQQDTNQMSDMEAWKKLTKYFSAIQNISSEVEVTDELSIDDLIGNVNRNDYYRYNGSLTTPTCNEAVVWTVFKESIKVDQNLMMMFPNRMGYQDVFRPTQRLHSRAVLSTDDAAHSVPDPVLLSLLLILTFSCHLLCLIE